MPRRSAGLLLYRVDGAALLVLLVHPGGPLWARRDLGAWSVPKGELAEGEDPQTAAAREFAEELGRPAPSGVDIPLGEVRQRGKRVVAWARRGDLDATEVTSNTFELEWPPRSGVVRTFPEVDRAAWFTVADARAKLLPSQRPFLAALVSALAGGSGGS